MPFTRVSFNSSPFYTGAYTIPYNPVELDLGDETNETTSVSLDGTPVIQKQYTNTTPIKMVWLNMPLDLTGFTTMVNTLKGYKQQIKYVNFASIDYTTTTTPTWRYIIVEDVKTSINRGGKLKMNVEMTLRKVNT